MSIPISFYPHINENILNKLGVVNGEFNFYYTKNKDILMETKYPDESRIREVIYFEDSNYEWDPDSFNLKLTRPLTISNPNFLFGSRGVAPKQSKLAIGVIWTCKASNIRGAKIIHTFGSDEFAPLQCNLNLEFPRGVLKKELNLEVIIYIKEPGKITAGEEILANQPGLNLGIISRSSIVIEGNGSIFPVVEVEEPNMPLWWVYCSWSDPQEDSFDEEHIKLCINKAHKYYSQVYNGKSVKDSPLFVEIMASAIQNIIHKVEKSSYWENIKQNYNNSPGSIGEAIYYFMSTFDWDFSSPELLGLTIRKYLEENL